MAASFASLLFVTLAEMGDKTQLLAMAFATRFAAGTVLAAVFLATLCNHALAVAAGRVLVTVVPVDAIALAAALSFILFGLWTLRGDALEGEDQRRSRFGPLVTVAIAFFLAELGDKTQLATISLAVKYENPLGVLLGTTAGMLVADSIGIVLGVVLGKRLPDALIRWASAATFMAFGVAGTAHVLGGRLPLAPRALVLFLVVAATLGSVHYLILRRGRGPAPAALPVSGRRGLPLWAYLGLILLAWLSSLGPVDQLVAVDHWVAFLVLGGLGWLTIHGAVRRPARPFATCVPASTLVLAALAGGRAVATGLAWPVVTVPLLLFALAVSVGLWPSGMPAAAHAAGGRLHRVWRRRSDLASGLALFAVAALTLLQHLA
jgi:putative Ca2+/H+ antiporter (TMEM165/GDT1 family)